MDFSSTIPGYHLKKQNIVRLILFTAAFALVFINIYSPFGVTTWFDISKLELLLYSSLVILTGVLVVVISRIIMYQHTKKGKTISLGTYLIWIAIEILSMSLFYTFYELLFLNDPRSFFEAVEVSILNTSLVLLLPYSALWLYFSWKDSKEKLEKLKAESETPLEKKGMVVFNDEKGTMRLTLKLDDLLYLKGADNYVTIYYNNNQKQEKFLLRNTIKQLEESLKPFDVIRCHRSFMINFNKVKLIERGKDGLKIKLDIQPNIEIPISKTYSSEVFTLFGKNN